MTDEPKKADPLKINGVVAVLTDDAGRVAAHYADFGQSRPGGFELREAQRHRAERGVAAEFIFRYGAEIFAKVVNEFTAARIMGELCAHHGWRLTMIDVEYVEEEITSSAG